MSAAQQVVQIASEGSGWQSAFEALAANESEINLTVVPVTSAKKALKYLRKEPDIAAIVVSVAAHDTHDLETLSRSIRGVMHNQTIRIVACAEDDEVSGSQLVNELGANAVLPIGLNTEDRLLSQISSELKTHAIFRGTRSQHQAETGLLTAITRLSRQELKLSECLFELAKSTAMITNAVLANVIVVRRDDSLRRSSVSFQQPHVNADTWLQQDQAPDSLLLRQVLVEEKLQLQVKSEDNQYAQASEALGCEIAGRFVFPLRSFGRTMCMVDCWLPAEGLGEISVDLVRLIEKSSEQFSLLFEKKQADSQLKKQYNRLRHTLDELTSTKEALYHSEKLASLGQLAAGIAHEINNPVAYVMGNFSPLNDYVASMSRMLDLHAQFVSTIDEAELSVGSELRQQIEQAGEDLDMEFVMEDVRALVSDSKDGLLRVRDIVINLNEFARKDSVDAEPTDLNANIHSTLRILHSELKLGIEVVLDLADLPMVNCHSGLISQVLLNLIKNGAQAMGGKGVMNISSSIEDGFAAIRVRDSGSGIPDDVIEKIFDPFFTTKEVGSGTGLGLSLCHGIIQRHQGILEVAETGPSGTEFLLALPLGDAPSPETDE